MKILGIDLGKYNSAACLFNTGLPIATEKFSRYEKK